MKSLSFLLNIDTLSKLIRVNCRNMEQRSIRNGIRGFDTFSIENEDIFLIAAGSVNG